MYLGTPAGRIREYLVGSFLTPIAAKDAPYNELGCFGFYRSK
jgi:hypothetical protein